MPETVRTIFAGSHPVYEVVKSENGLLVTIRTVGHREEKIEFLDRWQARSLMSLKNFGSFVNVPKKSNHRRQFKVGDKIRVNMHSGKIVDATIKAIINSIEEVKYQVDFGNEQSARVHEWQVVRDREAEGGRQETNRSGKSSLPTDGLGVTDWMTLGPKRCSKSLNTEHKF